MLSREPSGGCHYSPCLLFLEQGRCDWAACRDRAGETGNPQPQDSLSGVAVWIASWGPQSRGKDLSFANSLASVFRDETTAINTAPSPNPGATLLQPPTIIFPNPFFRFFKNPPTLKE